MKPTILIVDGHSIIFQWVELAIQHAQKGMLARETLSKILRNFQDNTDWHIVLVFDGKGTTASEASEKNGIQVFYSKFGQTADSVIERLVAKYAGTYDVTVATDDGLERTTVESFGGSTMSSRHLREAIQAADRGLEERLEKLRRR